MLLFAWRPFWRLWLPVGLSGLAVLLATAYMHSQPWMGLVLEKKNGQFHAQQGVLLAINGQAFEPQDLVEDPGVIERDTDFARLMQRQEYWHQALQQPHVQLTWQTAAGHIQMEERAVQTTRPLHTLPVDFWLQCLVGIACMLIGAWVWTLRPDDWAARLFSLTGFCVLLFSLSAACYSSRGIALASADFQTLAFINRFGATAYGFAGMAFFLRYPLPVLGLRWLWGFLAAQILLHTAIWLGWLPQFASQLTTGLQMLAMLIFILLQAWFCRRRPVERAALIWLGISVALGAGGFIASQVLPDLLGYAPLASQGMSFMLFLLPYIGIALGLTRYRLFDVGTWGFRLLFFMFGAVLLLLLDAALVWLLDWSNTVALGVALLTVGFVYLPLRAWLQGKLLRRAELPRSELFARAMGVAFAADSVQRQNRWQDLLDKIYQPLRMEVFRAASSTSMPAGIGDGQQVKILDSGASLYVPSVADLAPLQLFQAYEGKGLFSPQQAQLAERLVDLLEQAQASRQAYERGVQAERLRVAQDLHDDIGAHLLTAIHRADPNLRPLLQDTLNDVRSIAQGLADTGSNLEVLLPEMRHEAIRRCEAAGVELDWPPEQTAQLLAHCPCPEGGEQLDYRARRVLVSVLREGVSNALKHAAPSVIAVRYRFLPQQQCLQLDIYDNGCGFNAERLHGQGMGIHNLLMRVQRIGGQLSCLDTQEYGLSQGGLLRLTLPVHALLAKTVS